MTPRATADPPLVVGVDLTDVLAEAGVLAQRLRDVVTEDPDRRLTAVRAYADRLMGMIESVTGTSVALAHARRREEDRHDRLLSQTASEQSDRLVARGLASDERQWYYARANSTSRSRLADLRIQEEDVNDVLRYLRWLDQVFDRHRLEALSLSNRKRSITAKEYHEFVSEDGLPGSVL